MNFVHIYNRSHIGSDTSDFLLPATQEMCHDVCCDSFLQKCMKGADTSSGDIACEGWV